MHPCVALYKYLTILYKIFSYFQGRNASQVTVLLALFQQISQASAAIDRIVTVLSFSKKKENGSMCRAFIFT